MTIQLCRSCHSILRRGTHNLSRGLPKKLQIAGVKNVLLVASGKGGVGKSTIATNLAITLSKRCSVGLLDADVFGPSIPLMMNISDTPEINHQNLIIPVHNYNIKCMSMGLLVDEQAPVVWRGLMVMQAIRKLLRGVRWGPLDVLVIDMPPGTGDTQLSVTQEVPIQGVVLVTTPQSVALADCIKGAEMFRKVDVPILGVVENMSYYHCSSCNKQHHIFGRDVGHRMKGSALSDVPILGKLPIKPDISQHCDSGTPTVILDSEISEMFDQIAHSIIPSLNLEHD